MHIDLFFIEAKHYAYDCVMRKNRGYTLLELLVVITVIVVIASVGFVSYAGTSKKARDTKRKADLDAIAKAMEQYYSVCAGVYPAPSSGYVPTSIVCASPAQTIMATVPTDPTGNNRYTMTQPSGTTSSFSVCLPDTPPLEAESTTPYCRTNLQ
jgi:prepilin-type N-terminal cleavage/methylation domain-containing protein